MAATARARRSDLGASSMELALLTPILILVILSVVQFTMIFHARHVALAAAQSGARVARSEPGGSWRAEAREREATDMLGRAVRDALGGLATIPEVLGLAEGAREPAEDEAEIADRLRLVHRFYAEALGAAAREVAVA